MTVQTILSAVAHVLAGRTADGAAVLMFRPSFTTRTDAISALADQVGEVLTACRGDGLCLSTEQLTALIFKLASHCCRTGRQTPAAIRELPTFALGDAIAEAPEVLTGPISVQGILRAHAVRARQAAARAAANTPIPAPTVIATGDDTRYTLVELTLPAHLLEESRALGHCVGTAIAPDGIELSYAARIRGGAIRILSLRCLGEPCATIEFDLKKRAITQIQGASFRIDCHAPYFPALCQLLHGFARRERVCFINGLPGSDTESCVLTRFGTIEPFRPDLVQDLLGGTAIVGPHVASAVIEELCDNPLIVIDITRHMGAPLPARVRAEIATSASHVQLTGVRYATAIHAENAILLEPNSLVACPFINAGTAASVRLNPLRLAGDLYAESARIVELQSLERAKLIEVNRVNRLEVPRLRRANYVFAHHAAALHAPRLEAAESIGLSRAHTLVAPRLARCGMIHAPLLSVRETPLLAATPFATQTS